MDALIASPIFDPSGYASFARSIALELYQKGLNLKIMPINNWDASNLELAEEEKQILVECTQTVLIEFAPFISIAIPEQFYINPIGYNIGYSMIETSGIPDYWVRICNSMNEIWVPTHASKESFVNSGVKEDLVRVMPGGVDINTYSPNTLPMELPCKDKFTFLVNIEWIPRKCGAETVAAFLNEFDADEEVALVLKAYNAVTEYQPKGNKIVNSISEIKEELGKSRYPNIIFLPQIIPGSEMPKLYSAADCVVLASRGEGWGLPVTEAMATGKPYIATNYSGMKDIISDDTGYLLGITGTSEIPPYGVPNDRVITGFEWADPDFEHLQRLMRHVFENQTEAKAKGVAGRKYAETELVWNKATDTMISRLQTLRHKYFHMKFIPHTYPKINAEAKEVAFVIPSMGKVCGIADYTQDLGHAIANQTDQFKTLLKTATPNPLDPNIEPLVLTAIEKANVFHYQIEYGLYDSKDFYVANKMLNDNCIVGTLHSYDENEFDYNNILKRVMDKIIVHSDEIKKAMVQQGWNADQIQTIPHGCWDLGIQKKRTPDRVKKVGSFGFLFPQKGWIEMATAMAELPEYEWHLFSSKVPNHQNSELYYAKMVRYLRRLNAPNIIWDESFLGENELTEKLAEMDLIVLPYTVFLNQHAISGAARRCLATKVPLMCTDNTYFADLKEEAYKIPMNEPEMIQEGIVLLDKNPELRERLVLAAESFIEQYSWEAIAKQHIDFWRAL